MSHVLRDTLLRQFELAWALTEYHLDTLSTQECLWRPASKGLHVHAHEGTWTADWPEHERYDLGPASIAWLTWHMLFWWSSVLDHNFAQGTVTRQEISWPGTAEATRQRIAQLASQWRERLSQLTDADLLDVERTRWPFADKPFSDVVGWLNVELAKNAAELGYVRFLYAARSGGAA